MTVEVDLPHLYSGKVRDIYDAGEGRLLLVTSDRHLRLRRGHDRAHRPTRAACSPPCRPSGSSQLADVAPSHLISTDLDDLPAGAQKPELAGRVMLCRKAEMLPLECIVRGYITGSAWKEYRTTGHHARHAAARGAARVLARCPSRCSRRRPRRPRATTRTSRSSRPSSWSAPTWPARARDVCLELYRRGAAWALERGIIIADTKFELGLVDGELVVADEVLTPDSSRFWPADAGESRARPRRRSTSSRCATTSTGSTGTSSPRPRRCRPRWSLATRDRYVEAYERITGLDFADWPSARGSQEPVVTRRAWRRASMTG